MAKVVGDIAVKVGADVGPLQRNMKRAGQSVDDFDARAKRMALNVAKAGAAIAGAMVAATTAILAAGREAAAVGVEIKNLSSIAGVGTTEFQRYSAASRSVGIEQEKLADIFKDVNDKFGDYMATGAGPLADFFENIAPLVGVTADQFARLSGPEALQLYVTSLEQAGVSQQQMTFYMEALASDATALVPLLQDGGQAMRSLGDEAQRAGRILDEDMIAAAAELDQELRDLSDTIKLNATAAILEHKDEIIALANFITETLIPAVSSLAETLSTVALGWKTIADEARAAIRPITDALNLTDRMPGAGGSDTAGNLDRWAEDEASANAMGGGDPSSTGQFYVDDQGNVRSYGEEDTPSIPGITAPADVYSGRGNAAGPTADEAMQAYIEARREALAEVETVEEEHGRRVQAIREENTQKLTALQQKWQGSALDQTQTFFGDTAAAFAGGNEKMVAIGQKFAKIEALINAGRAFAQVAADPKLPWYAKIPAAIGVAAAISSFSKQSGIGGGGSEPSGGAQQTQPQQQEATTFAFTIQNDPMGFGESFARQMIEQLNASQRNGGRIQGVIA